jgi:hypothetical protein
LVLRLLLSWYFSTIGKASLTEVPVIFLFLFTAIACSFAAFAYAEFASMVPVSGALILIPMLPSGIDSLGYWLGLDNGICHWEYYSRHILERLFYEFNGEYH